jgi:hypothetical protein
MPLDWVIWQAKERLQSEKLSGAEEMVVMFPLTAELYVQWLHLVGSKPLVV